MKAELRLKDLGKFKTGLTYSPDNLCEPHEGVLVLRSANIQNDKIDLNDCVYVNNKIDSNMYVRKGDILVCSRNGSANLVGKTAIIEKDMNATWGAFMMLLKTQYNSKYINYLLNATIRKEKGRFATSTINQLTNSMLGGIHVDIFTEEVEQQRIVDYLDAKLGKIGARITILEKQQDAYARLKRSVIHHAVTRGLDPNVSLKDSGVEWIGMIPEHWEVKRIKDTVSLRNEKTADTRRNYVGLENVVSWDAKFVETNIETEGINSVFHEGDILFGKLRPYLAKGIIASYDGICSTEFFVLCAKRNVKSRFLLYYVLSHKVIDYIKNKVAGVKMPRTNWIEFSSIPVPLPPLSEQQSIAAYLDEKCAKINASTEIIGKQIDALKRLKRALINEVVTGQRAV